MSSWEVSVYNDIAWTFRWKFGVRRGNMEPDSLEELSVDIVPQFVMTTKQEKEDDLHLSSQNQVVVHLKIIYSLCQKKHTISSDFFSAPPPWRRGGGANIVLCNSSYGSL